ncbi:MAG: SAM-dependent methyltransferase [Gammaproteobacteria bacterium]|nr:SAM-dependent methyltransferase [Gammaproteobacteria bacterium]NNJ49504.1 SAM-dependent methyltransferase [Gammaproteobacteria bacterium]
MFQLAGNRSATPPLVSIFILSAAALAYEVLLIRLFSIIHWHHFAFMVISIALLGYGASGSFITVFRHRMLNNFDSVFIINTVFFGLSAIACFIAVQQLPFNALEILWDSSQWQRLLLSYLLLTLPFFFVANAIALTLMRYHNKISLVYGVDLIGAGIGAILVMLLLQYFTPVTIIRVLAISGITAGIFAFHNLAGVNRKLFATLLLLSMLAVYLTPHKWLDLRPSEYKGLTQTLQMKEASLLYSHSSPVSQTDVVQSPFIPFRNAPGMSLQSEAKTPEQLAVFRDGGEMTTIDHVTDISALEYHDFLSSALPYHLHDSAEKLLILSSATGAAILQADYHELPQIDAVEPDEQLSLLITERFAEYFGWHRIKHKVEIHTIAPRGFAASDNDYDLVVMGPSGASAGGSAGVYALSTSYDYTVEALQSYLELLADDGLLSITMWTSTPERGNLKLFTTAVAAMNNTGISEPQNNIAWIRSWNTATLILKKTALTAEQIKRVREFSLSRSFDLAWLPGITPNDVNQFQLLQEPVFYLAARSVLQQQSPVPEYNFIEQYKFDIRPTTDNRPYFNNFFMWSSFDEFLAMPGQAGISMIGVGYPTLLFTLVQASMAAVVLILLPLLLLRSVKVKTEIKREAGKRKNIVIYFMAIGLAFLFIEIAFIQKFTLILSQPLYAVAVALCAFLIFSGCGSLYVQRLMETAESSVIPDLIRRSVILIAVIVILYITVLPSLSSTIMALPETVRIISAFIMAAPLAFVMGMPFPLGMAVLQQNHPHLMPWAWGINGCASVLSAVLAVLLAMEIGFSGIMLCAVILYLIAWRSNRM